MVPVGGKRKIQRAANQRQSLGRFGNCGSNFFRRSTTVAVLDALETADVKVRIVNVLAYSGLVGLTCGYSKQIRRIFIDIALFVIYELLPL